MDGAVKGYVGPSIATDVKAEGSRSAAAWVDELNRERVDEEAERVVETRSHPKMRRLRKIRLSKGREW
jgi:hypothetical protein